MQFYKVFVIMQEKIVKSFIPGGLKILQVFWREFYEFFLTNETTNTAPAVSSEVLKMVDGILLLK